MVTIYTAKLTVSPVATPCKVANVTYLLNYIDSLAKPVKTSKWANLLMSLDRYRSEKSAAIG